MRSRLTFAWIKLFMMKLILESYMISILVVIGLGAMPRLTSVRKVSNAVMEEKTVEAVFTFSAI